MQDRFLAQLKQDIQQLCEEKYGQVFVVFDQLVPEGENVAAVRFTVSDQHGFITRHYGKAGYHDQHLWLDTMTI
jgi:glutathione peroxidase-family protein